MMNYPTMKDVLKMNDEDRKALEISLIDDFTYIGSSCEDGRYRFFDDSAVVETSELIDLNELYYSGRHGYIYKGQSLDHFIIGTWKY